MELKTFMKTWLHNQQLAIPSTNTMAPLQVSTNAMQFAAVSLSKDDAKALANQMSQLLASDSVMAGISDQIGEPRPDESEDEFVERAKKAARQVLRRALNTSR